MKGTDLTDWQLSAAEKFLRQRGRRMDEQPREIDRIITIPWGDFIRVVAWYGQIRAHAVANGAPPDEPGETYVVNHEQTEVSG